MSFLFSSSNVEKVDGGLNISVKDERSDSLALQGSGSAATEFKVRIEHRSGAGAGGGKKQKSNLPTWSPALNFTCSCGKTYYRNYQYTQSPICKHIGACLIVHFHQFALGSQQAFRISQRQKMRKILPLLSE